MKKGIKQAKPLNPTPLFFVSSSADTQYQYQKVGWEEGHGEISFAWVERGERGGGSRLASFYSLQLIILALSKCCTGRYSCRRKKYCRHGDFSYAVFNARLSNVSQYCKSRKSEKPLNIFFISLQTFCVPRQ